MKHNKLPEFIFGQLDQLLRYRPNSSLLTNESFLIYSHNKTREWFESLSAEDKHKMIEEARKEGKELRKSFHNRPKEIQEKRVAAQRKRQRELEEREKKRIHQAENLINDVCIYGLWQSLQQVMEGLKRLKDNEKRTDLEAQIKFRKTVLHQKHPEKKVLNLSKKNEGGRYVKLFLKELEHNITQLIEDTLGADTVEEQTDNLPLLVCKNIEHKFSDDETYKGLVISVVPGFPKWYNVKYDGDDAVYAYNLHHDYKNGDLRIMVSRNTDKD